MTAHEILRALANGTTVAGPMLPAPGSVVCGWVAAALGLAADLAEAGATPASIERIRKAHPLLAGVEDEWADRIRGNQTAVPEPVDDPAFATGDGAVGASDPYEDPE